MEEAENVTINWRLLALNVIKRALQDVVRPTCCHRRVRKSAKQSAFDFLFTDAQKPDLKMYAELGGLNFTNLQKRAKEIFDNQIDIAKLEEQLQKEISLTSDTDDDEVIH